MKAFTLAGLYWTNKEMIFALNEFPEISQSHACHGQCGEKCLADKFAFNTPQSERLRIFC
jgi:hypothetical protein